MKSGSKTGLVGHLGRAPSDAVIASLKELDMGSRDMTELTSPLRITKTMTEKSSLVAVAGKGT